MRVRPADLPAISIGGDVALRGPTLMLALQAGRDDLVGPVLCAALRAWLDDERDTGPDLMQRLGLPRTRNRVRNKLRDALLVEAAERLMPSASPQQKAVALKEYARIFARQRWPAWQGKSCPPGYATTVERLVHRAFVLDEGKRRCSGLHSIGEWSDVYFRRLLRDTPTDETL